MYIIPSPTKFSKTPNFSSNPWIEGFEQKYVSDTIFTVGPGAARALTTDFVISYPTNVPGSNGLIRVDTSVIGLNGCYPRALSELNLTHNTVFSVYIVASSSGTSSGNNSTSVIVATGDNFLPDGYDAYRRIGLIYIFQSDLSIAPWTQSGLGAYRKYTLKTPVNAVQNGSVTTLTPVDLSINHGVVPPGNPSDIMITWAVTNSDDNQTVTFSPGGVGSANATFTGNAELWNNAINITAGTNTAGRASLSYRVAVGDQIITWGVREFSDYMGNSIF